MNTISTQDLRRTINLLAEYFRTQYKALNELDGKLGDGDIGITMKLGLEAASASSADWSQDLGMAFMSLAKSFVASRASSYGTLLSTGMMAAAQYCKGKTVLHTTDIAPIFKNALEKMSKRGKSELGQKTVLDAINAAYMAAINYEGSSFEALGTEIRYKVKMAVEDFANKPNLQGRARIFGEKSIGIPDPGMQVFFEMLIGLTEKNNYPSTKDLGEL